MPAMSGACLTRFRDFLTDCIFAANRVSHPDQHRGCRKGERDGRSCERLKTIHPPVSQHYVLSQILKGRVTELPEPAFSCHVAAVVSSPKASLYITTPRGLISSRIYSSSVFVV